MIIFNLSICAGIVLYSSFKKIFCVSVYPVAAEAERKTEGKRKTLNHERDNETFISRSDVSESNDNFDVNVVKTMWTLVDALSDNRDFLDKFCLKFEVTILTILTVMGCTLLGALITENFLPPLV